jgi:hypothetical protein
MTPASKPQKGGRCNIQVFFVKRDHLNVQASKKSKDVGTGILAQPGRQDHSRFEQRRDADHDNFGMVDCLDESFASGLFQVDGDDRGTIQNHGQ